MIHERVELIPCIVVATSIEGFTNEDFAEEYQDMTRITKMEILMNIQNIFLASRIYSHQLQSVPMPEIRYLCWPHSRS